MSEEPLKRYSEELLAGSFPDRPERAVPFLHTLVNAKVADGSIKPLEGKVPLFQKPQAAEPVVGIISDDGPNGDEVYHGTLSDLWYWAATATGAVESRTATSIGSASATAYGGQKDTTATGEATIWSFAPWGTWMVASNGKDPLQLDEGTGFDDLTTTATSGSTAQPFSAAEVVITRDPFMIAMNTSSTQPEDGKKTVRWCDRDNVRDWTATSLANFAGVRSVRDVDGEIVCAVNFAGEVAFFSRVAMHIMEFIGSPRVFSTRKVQKGIGALSKQAVAAYGARLYGFGEAGLWEASTEGFRYIDSGSVHDLVYKNINLGQKEKVVVAVNPEQKNVFFYYPSSESLDNDKFVVYSIEDGTWAQGEANFSSADNHRSVQYLIVGTTVGDVLEDGPVGSLSLAGDVGTLTYTATSQLVSGFGELGFGELGFGGVTPFNG